MPAKYRVRFRKPTCRECGSSDISATSSQQYRMIGGRRQQAADAVCNECGHTWWSISPVIRALARKLDVERRAREAKSGKKKSTTVGAKGTRGRKVTTLPKGWAGVLKPDRIKAARKRA